jgi:hypothetical protein
VIARIGTKASLSTAAPAARADTAAKPAAAAVADFNQSRREHFPVVKEFSAIASLPTMLSRNWLFLYTRQYREHRRAKQAFRPARPPSRL